MVVLAKLSPSKGIAILLGVLVLEAFLRTFKPAKFQFAAPRTKVVVPVDVFPK